MFISRKAAVKFYRLLNMKDSYTCVSMRQKQITEHHSLIYPTSYQGGRYYPYQFNDAVLKHLKSPGKDSSNRYPILRGHFGGNSMIIPLPEVG